MNHFLSIILMMYVLYTLIYCVRFSIKAKHLNIHQKLWNILLFWLLPFMWTIVIDKEIRSAPESSKSGKRPSHLKFNHDETGVSMDDGHFHHASDEIDWHAGDD